MHPQVCGDGRDQQVYAMRLPMQSMLYGSLYAPFPPPSHPHLLLTLACVEWDALALVVVERLDGAANHAKGRETLVQHEGPEETQYQCSGC